MWQAARESRIHQDDAPKGWWRDALTVGLPALAGVVISVSDLLTILLQGVPQFALWIQAVFPLSLTLVCGYLAVAKVTRSRTILTTDPSSSSEYRTPRFSLVARRTALVMLVPLIALSASHTWRALPNALLGRVYVAGFITDMSGRPVTRGYVEALDALGEEVSVTPAPLGTTSGYFFLDLKPWGGRAVALRISGSRCPQAVIPVHTGWVASPEWQRTVARRNVGSATRWTLRCVPDEEMAHSTNGSDGDRTLA